MRDYDGRTSVDFKGRGKGEGAKGGSLLGEFFPPNVKDVVMKPPGEIGMSKYPDTAEAIFREQEGNVHMANKDRASAMKRK
jgi:hypothetical protein